MPRVKSAAVSGALGSCCSQGAPTCRMLGSRDDDEPRTLAFECDNNQDLRVRLSSDREEARVEVDDQEFLLEEAGRDNGQRVYSDNNDVRLTVSDDEAYLRIPGEADYQDCERT
jgi:hypothetical protein